MTKSSKLNIIMTRINNANNDSEKEPLLLEMERLINECPDLISQFPNLMSRFPNLMSQFPNANIPQTGSNASVTNYNETTAIHQAQTIQYHTTNKKYLYVAPNTESNTTIPPTIAPITTSITTPTTAPITAYPSTKQYYTTQNSYHHRDVHSRDFQVPSERPHHTKPYSAVSTQNSRTG